jgi:hypothetical protein
MSDHIARFNNMFGIKKVLQLDYEGKYNSMLKKNKDRVVCISGYEGIGKSNLLLHIFHFWYEEILKQKIDENFIKFLASNKKEFVLGLKSAPPYYMVAHDEAGKDLYNRNSQSNFNKDLNIAYIVIRARKLYTILVIPSLLDLDSYFRKRRVTALMHVYGEGRVAYYSKRRLRRLLPAMEYNNKMSADPNPLECKDILGNNILPNFTDTFTLYEGVLLKKYLERKDKNMDESVDYLVEKYGEDENAKEHLQDIRGVSVLEALEAGGDMHVLRKQFQTNTRSVVSWLTKLSKNKKYAARVESIKHLIK